MANTPYYTKAETEAKIPNSLKNATILAYGDSITDEDEWLNIVKDYTGADYRNIAIGGANIAVSGTRDEVNNPYDWRVDYPNSASDTYSDRHLYPQVIHTPNTLRHKYDLVTDVYLEEDGRYIFRPDIVILAIGFNDYKNTPDIPYESYSSVKGLTVPELETRINDNIIIEKKIFSHLRLSLEKLLSGEIIESGDGITYGIDCRMSKFLFITPIQSAHINPLSALDLLQFSDYLQDCLDDYSIKRVDGYRDCGISNRYEVDGAAGRYLIDGIHPNTSGYEKMGQLISGQILSVYKK